MDGPIPEVLVEGDGRSRGRAHGEALRPLVHEHLERWLTAIGEDLGVEPRAYLEHFLAQTNFLPAIDRWTPDLLEEVKGIAEGAGTPFALTLARQLSDEEPWFRRAYRLSSNSALGCSSIGRDASASGPAIVAQNMDVPRWFDGTQIILRVRDSVHDVECLMLTVAGKISLAGMNDAGLGMCCNTLSQLDYAKDGLPEDFVVRGFLSHRRLEDGLDFLHRIKHASGQNYTVGAPGRPVLNLECSARSITTYRPEGVSGRVFHTNHPFTNPDQDLFRRMSEGMDETALRRFYFGNSRERFTVLENHLGRPSAVLTTDLMKTVFSDQDAPVSRLGSEGNKNDNFTLACLIMTLDTQPSLEVAPGPPCRTPFQTFHFS